LMRSVSTGTFAKSGSDRSRVGALLLELGEKGTHGD